MKRLQEGEEKYYCKFGNFRENFIFVNIVKRDRRTSNRTIVSTKVTKV